MTNQEEGVAPQALSCPVPTLSSEALLTDGTPIWGRLGPWGTDHILSSPCCLLPLLSVTWNRTQRLIGSLTGDWEV